MADDSTAKHFVESEAEERLAEVLDHYFDALQQGNPPDREALFAEHPDLVDELKSCLDGIDFVHGGGSKEIPAQLGDFRILREIGRGGMGIVYEAEQISLSRLVALKVQRYPISDPETLERFQREAETAANLHHTNIVPIHAIGRHDDVHFFAMQLVEGMSLAAVIEEATLPIDWRDAAEWGLQACDALIHAHQRGVIHRDVKPSNLILDTEGRIWLTDFGLAKRQGDTALSITGVILGTPRYMSPEQAHSVKNPVDHRTDIYSLGATLYEVLSGRPLFEANSPHAILDKILNEIPASLRKRRPDIPADVDTIISKCLRKSVSDRYDSAADLSNDLRAVLDGRSIRARRPSIWSRVKRTWAQHRPQITTAAFGALLAVVLIAVTVGWGTWYRASQMGQLLVTTDSSTRLTAEILDEEGRAVVDAFALPLQQPVDVPDGTYRLRVSAPGEMGETYWISIERGKSSELKISLSPRRQQELELSGAHEIVRRANRDDIIEFANDRITLHHGASESAWSLDARRLSQEPKILAADPNFNFNWQTDAKVTGRGALKRHPRVVSPAPDLNQDGIGDIVLALRHRATVIALDGSNGECLWAVTGEAQKYGGSVTEYGTVWGEPLLKDIDGDGTLDLIGLFAHTLWQRDEMIRLLGTRWIQAVSGRSGKTLWNRELSDAWFNDWYGETTSMAPPACVRWRANGQCQESLFPDRNGSSVRTLDNGLFVPFPIQEVKVDQHAYGMVVVCNTVCLFDLENGLDYVAPRKLGFCPIRPPQVFDVEGDGSDEVLLCHQKRMGTQGTASGEIKLHVQRLLDGQGIWSYDARADWQWQFDFAMPMIEWPRIVDLDGDQTAEIVIAAPPNSLTASSPRSEFLTVLDAKTGQPEWSDPSAIYSVNGQLDHFINGPDLNQDGTEELYVVSQHIVRPERGPQRSDLQLNQLFLDVICGATGKTLAVRSAPLFVEPGSDALRLGRLFWWHQGNAGRLVIGLRGTMDSDIESVTVFFDPAKLEFSQYAVGAELPQLVDVDGDSILDLTTFSPRQRAHLDVGGSLQVWMARPMSPWRTVGQHARIINDIDGDGTPDVAAHAREASTRLTVYSGRDGRRVWQRTTGLTNGRSLPIETDLNGDGVSDLLVSRHGWQSNNDAPVLALSGRTGEEIWRLRFSELVQQWYTPQFAIETPLSYDGESTDFIWVGRGVLGAPSQQRPNPDRIPSWLMRVDSKLGTIRWRRKLLDTSRFPRRRVVFDEQLDPSIRQPSFSQFLEVIPDVDGDAVKDMLSFGLDNTLSLLAISGDTGDTIWGVDVSNHYDFTPPMVVDLNSDERPEIVMLSFDYRGRSLILSVHCVDAVTGAIPGFLAARGRTTTEIFETKVHLSLDRVHGSGPQLKWGFPHLVPVRIGSSSAIGFWIRNPNSQIEFVTLRHGDEPSTPVSITYTPLVEPADVQGGSSWLDHFRAWCADVNGDHIDEVIAVTPQGLRAFELVTGRVVWNRELDDASAIVLGIGSMNDATKPAIQLLSGTNERTALDLLRPSDGLKVATAGTMSGNVGQILNRLDLIASKGGLPHAVVADDADRAQLVSALPIETTEAYPQGMALDGIAETPRARRDVRYARSMPWSHMANRSFVQTLVWPALISMVLGTGLVYLPGRFIGTLISTRRMTVAQLALAPCLVGLAIVLLRVPLPGLPELTYTANRSTNRVIARLVAAVTSGLPFIYVAIVMARTVMRRQWNRLIVGALAMIACASIIAAVAIASSWKKLEHGEYLMLDGWWSLLLIGAQAVALVLILQRIGLTLLGAVYSPRPRPLAELSETQQL